MPRTTPQGEFPMMRNKFSVELYEKGNAPDYSIVYAQGVKAGRGFTEGYPLKNCPKDQDNPTIDITGNPSTDMCRFNYIYIHYGETGDQTKAFFIVDKCILNYPEHNDHTANKLDDYTIRYTLRLDVWETYKDKIGTPDIKLEKVTTNNPEGWKEYDRYNDDILPFSAVDISLSDTVNTDWKKVIAWQAKKPDSMDNYIIDGMVTPYQYSDSMADYKEAIKELANEPPAATNIFKSYVSCNSYVLPSNFATEDGSYSTGELLTLATPDHGLHGRLNYFPYKRAFVKTIDGQCVEFEQSQMVDSCLGNMVSVGINHSTTPAPHSVIFLQNYKNGSTTNYLVFENYPIMNLTGKVSNIWDNIANSMGSPMDKTGMDGLYW